MAAIGIALVTEASLPVLLAAGAVFGGFGIPIYSLCVAAANDDLPAGRLLGTARGLLLLNGLGTAAGPLVGGLAMNVFGPGGLFLYAALLMVVLAVAALPSPQARRSREAMSTRCPHTPLITLSLDALLLQHEGREERSKPS